MTLTSTAILLLLSLAQFPPIPAQALKCEDPVQCAGDPLEVACINNFCAPRSLVGGPCDRVGSVSGISDCLDTAPDGAKLDCLRGECVRTNVVPVGGTCIDPMQCKGKLSEVACINDKCAPRSRLGGPCDLVGSVAGFSDCLSEDDGVEMVCLDGRCVAKGVLPVPSRTPRPSGSSPPRTSPLTSSSESSQPAQSSSVSPSRTPQVSNTVSVNTGEEGDSNLRIILPSVIAGIFAVVAAALAAWIAKGRNKDPSAHPDVNVSNQQNTIIQVSTRAATG